MKNRKLTIEESFGQMIMLGLDCYDINEEIEKIIKKYKIGGVVLYKKNYTSIDTMIEFINKLKRINKENNNIPLFIAIDQENGRVNRFPNEIERIISAKKIASLKETEMNYIHKLTTYLLNSVGVNMNFAPVLDVVRDSKNKAIGNRSYGNDSSVILKCALDFMKEMQKNNIISVVKHFPGHGLTNRDSHVFLPKIKDIDTMKQVDIKVFYDAIKSGADAIMVGHLTIKGYGIMPASINKKIVSDLLINNGYKGLIITDDLRMKPLRLLCKEKKCVKKAINVGNDILMIKYKKGDLKRLYDPLMKQLKKFEIDIEKVSKSAKKVISYKNKYKITDELIDNKLDIVKINKNIRKLNEKFK